MKKKMYQQPQLRIVDLHCKQLIMGSGQTISNVVSGDTGLKGAAADGSITGGGGTARGREYDCWGDEDE